MTHKARVAGVEASGAERAQLSLEVPDGLGKGWARSGAGMLEPRSLMVSLPWCRQGYPLKTPISSCFSWPKALHCLLLSLGVKSKFLTKDHEDLTGPLTSDLCAPCIWVLQPMKACSCLKPLNRCSLGLDTFPWNGHVGTPSRKDLPHHLLPPLSTPAPTVSFFSKVPLITWYYIIFLLFFFFHLLEGRSFIWCFSSHSEDTAELSGTYCMK